MGFQLSDIGQGIGAGLGAVTDTLGLTSPIDKSGLAYAQMGQQRYGQDYGFANRQLMPQDYMNYLQAVAGGQQMGQGYQTALAGIQGSQAGAMSAGLSMQGAPALSAMRMGGNNAAQLGAMGQATLGQAQFQDQDMARQALMAGLLQNQGMSDNMQSGQENLQAQMLSSQYQAEQGYKMMQAQKNQQLFGAGLSAAAMFAFA